MEQKNRPMNIIILKPSLLQSSSIFNQSNGGEDDTHTDQDLNDLFQKATKVVKEFGFKDENLPRLPVDVKY